MLDTVLGNHALKQSLQAALDAGRLSHSVLLVGESRSGVGYAARGLAADYLYPEGGDGAKAVMEQRSAECISVRGEGASGEIRIDRIRQVRKEVYETALSAKGRVVILYDVQKLNPSSANALLKVLEEPPQGVLFVLTASSAAAVMYTIRSRCSLYTIAPPSHKECAGWIQKHCPHLAQPQLVAQAYEGRIGKALALAKDAKRQGHFQAACQMVQMAAEHRQYQLLCLLSRYEKDKPGLVCLLEDGAALAASGLTHPTLGIAPARAAAVSHACNQALSQMARNVNQKLLLTSLAIGLAAV